MHFRLCLVAFALFCFAMGSPAHARKGGWLLPAAGGAVVGGVVGYAAGKSNSPPAQQTVVQQPQPVTSATAVTKYSYVIKCYQHPYPESQGKCQNPANALRLDKGPKARYVDAQYMFSEGDLKSVIIYYTIVP